MSCHVLIVEDSEAKLESIRALLERNITDVVISCAHSVSSGRDILLNHVQDLIIADMSLPTYDIERRERGGTPRTLGGIEIFEHLDRFDLSIPVIVVTAYPSLGDGPNALSLEELRIRLTREFPLNFLGAVYFDSAYSIWESELIALLKEK